MRVVLALGLVLAFASAASAAPATPAYRLVSDEAREAKRVVAVRIDRRLAEADIVRIAEAVRGRPARGAQRTLIQIYLGRPRAGEVAWATATFAPELKVVINGLSVEEAEQMTGEARRDQRAVVGSWLLGAPVAPGRLTIYRDQGRSFAEWHLRGGHRTVEELDEARWNGGRRFVLRGDSSQHYTVLRDGALELRDATRLITSADPIDRNTANGEASATGATDREVIAAGSVVVRAMPVDVPGGKGSAAGSQGRAPSAAIGSGPVAAPLMRPIIPSPGGASTARVEGPAAGAADTAHAADPAAAEGATVPATATSTATATSVATGAAAATTAIVAAGVKPAGVKSLAKKPQHGRTVAGRTGSSRPSTSARAAADQSVAALMAAKFGQR